MLQIGGKIVTNVNVLKGCRHRHRELQTFFFNISFEPQLYFICKKHIMLITFKGSETQGARHQIQLD